MNNKPNTVLVDLDVITSTNLSDGAKVLYTYILGIECDEDCEDLSIMKALALTEASYLARKKELQDADLLLIENDVMYIGNSMEKASDSKLIVNSK
jgi:hypothetical protein